MIREPVTLGTRVRVLEHHRIAERRGAIGRVVGRYGGDGCMAVDVRFPDGQEWLFRPGDLEEVAPTSPPWWRLLTRKVGVR